MATDRQIAANQANAQKSTGPKTVRGKSVSSRNAVRHGALSKVAVAEHESEAQFQLLLNFLVEDHAPQTTIEDLLVERLAVLGWRETRLAKAEAFETKAHHEYQTEREKISGHPERRIGGPQTPEEIRALEKVLPIETQLLVGRYQTMLSNQISQTLKQLREEQKLREQAIEVAPKVTRDEE